MDRISEILAVAERQEIRPWIALKEKLAGAAIVALAMNEGPLVLQGGAALHFAYGSPRLSADVDFAGIGAGKALTERGPAAARAAEELLGRPATWTVTVSGRLFRGKLAIEIDSARRIVLPVEAFEVPARMARPHEAGLVEDAEEIAADKIVACADRLARRGVLKITDLYDLWYLRDRLGTNPPDPELVEAKRRDYGSERRGADLAAAARSVPVAELRETLRGFLPAREAVADLSAVIESAAILLGAYREIL